jgi:hypothetical protein
MGPTTAGFSWGFRSPGRTKHELPNGATYGQQLRPIHAPDDVADDGPHHLLRTCQAQVRRLLHDETRFGELERFHEVEVHAAVRQLHDDVRQGATVSGDILSLLESAEHRKRLLAKAVGVIETKGGL